MRNWLVQIFAPKECVLPKDLVYLILDYANMARFSRNASYFYIYASPHPLKRFTIEQKKSRNSKTWHRSTTLRF